jgi:two-component system nitrate/nitrite response regulator NarL
LTSKVSARRIRVLAGADQPLFRDAVARTVRQRAQFELVGEVGDGRAALDAIDRLRPDVAVLSLPLSGLDGERVLRAVVRDELPTRVVLLADAHASEVTYRALESGAAGCLTKGVTAEQLCEAISTAADGGIVLGGELHLGLAREIRLRCRDGTAVLTGREREILRLMADGRANGQIAATLHISVPTVKTHIRHLYEKLGTSDRAAAVAEAMRRGLVE